MPSKLKRVVVFLNYLKFNSKPSKTSILNWQLSKLLLLVRHSQINHFFDVNRCEALVLSVRVGHVALV